MTISNDVYLLIKSLSKKERSYVLKSFEKSEAEEFEFFKLFELMEAQVVYNEIEVKKALKYKQSAVAFSSLKNYLYEFVIDKLIYVNKHSNRILESNNTLQELNILYNKELFPAFFKRWQKANAIAHEYEDYAMILALKEQISNLRIRQIIKTDEEDFKKLQEEEVYIIDHFGKLQLLKSLYNRIVLLSSKNDIIQTEEDTEILNNIIGNAIFKSKPPAQSSFRYIYYFYMCKGLGFQLQGNYERSFEELINLRPFLEQRVSFLSTKPIFIYDYIEAMYPVCMYLNKYNNYFEIFEIPFIKTMHINSEYAYLSIYLMYSTLRFAHRTKNFELAEETRNKLVKILRSKDKIKHVHLERNIICSIAISYFVFANYEEAYYWGKQYYIIGAKHKKGDQYDFFHLFMVLICFELKQFTIFISEVNNSYQYFYRHKKLGKLEKIIINTLRKVPNAFFKTERYQMYQSLQTSLATFTEEEKKVNGFRFFNFYKWTCSKVREISYLDYLLKEQCN